MHTHANLNTHTYTHTQSDVYMCVHYIYCGMCVHCPSSRCWSSPLLLRFWLPRQQNTKYKKKVVFLLSASLFPSHCSLSSVFRPAVSSLLCIALASPSMLCALLCFCFICYFVVRRSHDVRHQLSLSRTLCAAAAATRLSSLALENSSEQPPLTLPLIIHWTNDNAPLCPTALTHTPLFCPLPLSYSLDDLHDATYNSNRLKRKTNKNELNRKT